jgi:hypothetical protein
MLEVPVVSRYLPFQEWKLSGSGDYDLPQIFHFRELVNLKKRAIFPGNLASSLVSTS